MKPEIRRCAWRHMWRQTGAWWMDRYIFTWLYAHLYSYICVCMQACVSLCLLVSVCMPNYLYLLASFVCSLVIGSYIFHICKNISLFLIFYSFISIWETTICRRKFIVTIKFFFPLKIFDSVSFYCLLQEIYLYIFNIVTQKNPH